MPEEKQTECESLGKKPLRVLVFDDKKETTGFDCFVLFGFDSEGRTNSLCNIPAEVNNETIVFKVLEGLLGLTIVLDMPLETFGKMIERLKHERD
jgi:hypothetical protein